MESMDEMIEDLKNDIHEVKGLTGASVVENIGELIEFYKAEIARERMRFDSDEQKLVKKIESVRQEIKTVEQETKAVQESIRHADESLTLKSQDPCEFLKEETEKIKKEYQDHVKDLIDDILNNSESLKKAETQDFCAEETRALRGQLIQELAEQEHRSSSIFVEVQRMRGFIAQVRCEFKDTQSRMCAAQRNGQLA